MRQPDDAARTRGRRKGHAQSQALPGMLMSERVRVRESLCERVIRTPPLYHNVPDLVPKWNKKVCESEVRGSFGAEPGVIAGGAKRVCVVFGIRLLGVAFLRGNRAWVQPLQRSRCLTLAFLGRRRQGDSARGGRVSARRAGERPFYAAFLGDPSSARGLAAIRISPAAGCAGRASGRGV